MTSAITVQSPLKEAISTQVDPLGLSPIPDDTRQRFLRFRLLEENKSLLPLQDIAEVKTLPKTDILPVPELKNSVLGVCNWRGDILCLVDLNALLGGCPLWDQMPLLEESLVIVVQSARRSVGLVVEKVNDIELIEPESIQFHADLCSSTLAPYVTGYLPDHEGMILDADAIVRHLFLGDP